MKLADSLTRSSYTNLSVQTCGRLRISIVGPCAAGKTVLAERFQQLDYNAHSCAQEHSYVPNMWRRIAHPDVLIYLDADLPAIARRRHINWGHEYLANLRYRLRNARQHCDLFIQTDSLSEEEVLAVAVRFLEAFPKCESVLTASPKGSILRPLSTIHVNTVGRDCK